MTDDQAWEKLRQLRLKWNFGPSFDTEEAAKEYYHLDYPPERRADHFVSICFIGGKWRLTEYVFH